MSLVRWWSTWSMWLRGVFHRDQVERDLEDELRDHVERQTQANIASGMFPDDAHRAALVAFGGVERIKDESRDVQHLSLIDSLGQLHDAFRSLRRARAFAIVSVATIALGVGTGSAAFTLVNAVLLRPLPYPASERLVGVWHAFPAMNMPLVRQAAGTFDAYRRLSTSFEAIGAFSDRPVAVTWPDGSGAPERVPMAGVSGSVFTMLGIRPLLGRTIDERDELPNAPRVIVISETYWRTKLGGDVAALGRSLRIEGRDYTIVGVMPSTFAFPSSDIRLWVVTRVRPDQYLGNFSFRAIGRLRPGITIDAAQRELDAILHRTPELFAEQRPGVSVQQVLAMTGARVVLRPLRDDAIGEFGRIVWLIGVVAAMLVAVGLSNLITLSLARAEARRRDLAVRATLGASRLRIWWASSSESLMLAVLGGTIGVCLASAALSRIATLGPTGLPDPLLANGGNLMLPRLNEVHVGWTLVISALVLTSLFAMASMLSATGCLGANDLLRVVREGGRSATAGRASHRLRGALVAFQVALSLVLLTGSMVLGRSLRSVLAVPPGFDPSNVYTTWMALGASYRTDSDVARFTRQALDRIAQIPGVAAVAATSKPPLQYGQSQRVTWVEDALPAAGVLPSAHPIVIASDGYFRTMGIPVVAGRAFNDANVQSGSDEAVVSQSFAQRYWHDSTGARAIGRRVRPYADGPWISIVGVVGDVRDTSLVALPQATLYLSAEPGKNPATADVRPMRVLAMVVRTEHAAPGIGRSVEQAIRSIDRDLPTYDSELLTRTVAKAGMRTALVLKLLACGTALTLVIGVIGLAGMMAYVVELRSREIGIRVALGLQPLGAQRMILRQGVTITGAGLVIGLLGFAAFARLLRNLVFGISATDTTTLGLAAVSVIVVGVIATWIPARRASGIDPAITLKME